MTMVTSVSSEPGIVPSAVPQADALMIVDNFLPREFAAAMRADIDSHFAAPYQHHPDTHQVWNFWFVPQTYTYLRTQPEKVINNGCDLVVELMGGIEPARGIDHDVAIVICQQVEEPGQFRRSGDGWIGLL